MRTPIVAGNWKMNMTIEQARSLVFAMSAELRKVAGVQKVLCPPFPALLAVHALLEGSDVALGAQNMYWEEKGAFTGEVSPLMVKELCTHVILGHSERRALFAETDETVNRRILAAEKSGLTPICCVGETLQQYEAGQTSEVVHHQISRGLSGLPAETAAGVVVAYEPVWAIGTGRASTPENAGRVVRDVIRPALAELFGAEAAAAIRVLYGGSVTGANAQDFFQNPDIDGALVGGASLKPAEFVAITRAAVPT
jgi:triosephosphate isomerase (TIM)